MTLYFGNISDLLYALDSYVEHKGYHISLVITSMTHYQLQAAKLRNRSIVRR